ncbi:MAG: AAA family ATPase [Promethearchaeota archaeon]
MLMLFCGIPASGKTTIANEVAKRLTLKAIHIQSDIIRHMIPKPIHNNIEDEVVYNAMNSLAKIALEFNYLVILDATFLRHERREQALSIAKGLGKKSLLIHVKCSLDAAITRNRMRETLIPEKIIKEINEFFEESLDALEIDSERISVKKAAELILGKMRDNI